MFLNALTVDLEDWYHVCGLDPIQPIPQSEWRVRTVTERILSALDEYRVKATFFVLGSVAEAVPGLVEKIAAGGHEIASHGWSHSLLHQLTPDEFRAELIRTEDIIVSQTGCRPIGFRAPQWSVSHQTPWVHEILGERGYRYDSSLNPLPFIGDRSGMRVPFRIKAADNVLWEFPPLVSPTWFGNLPTGGGWGFRFFPPALITHTMQRLNAAGHPAVLYLHPRDIDPDGPRLRVSPVKRFAAYGTRSDALPRVRMLLERFRFTTLRDLVANDLLHSDTVV